METSQLDLIIVSTVIVSINAPSNALLCKSYWHRERLWCCAKLVHTSSGLVIWAPFLYFAIASRRFWPTVLAIWVFTFIGCGDLGFLLFLHRKKIPLLKQWLHGSAQGLYRKLKGLVRSPFWPTSVDEPFRLPSRASLPNSAAGPLSCRDDPGTPPSPAPTSLRGHPGPSVPQPAVPPGGAPERHPDKPLLEMDSEHVSLPSFPLDCPPTPTPSNIDESDSASNRKYYFGHWGYEESDRQKHREWA